MREIKLIIPFLIISNLLFGQETKLVKDYYQNGKLEKEFSVLKTDKIVKHGEYKKYFVNGKIKELGYFDKGDSTGLWQRYYSLGEIKEYGHYEKDKRINVWYYYQTNGDIYRIFDFSKDKELETDLDNYPLNYMTYNYPVLARENQIEGQVIISFSIDSLCNCSDLKIEHSSDEIFYKSAIESAKEYMKYIENIETLECVEKTMVIPINFELK